MSNDKKNVISKYLPMIIIISMMFMMPEAFKQYSLHTEIQDFSYQALADNLDRYPEDAVFINQIREAIFDEEISGEEHKSIVDRLLETNGVYHGSTVGIDHSKAKSILISRLK